MLFTLKSVIPFCLLLSLGMAVISCTDALPEEKGLKDWSEFPIGGAVNIEAVLEDAKLQQIIKQNFNSLTATNDMKMHHVLDADGTFVWGKVDTLVAFCKKNKQHLFGHTLIWHEATPAWVTEKAVEDSLWLRDFLKEYVTTYVTHCKGDVVAWDVVNAAFESHGGAYRESVWYKVLGKEYIADAFRYAHTADPSADLFYNDYNIERDTIKLHSVLKMITALQKENVPITGIGFQMHLRMDVPDETIAYALKKAADTGLKIHLSEVDIIFNTHNDRKYGGQQQYETLTEEMKQRQANKYKNLVKIYRTTVPKEQQYGITFWDFTDRDTWIRSFFKLKDWPTVFDENLNPKPAYYGFVEGLKEQL